MKYSFLMPYYRRAGQLHNTLVSFCYHYSDRDDYEVMISEDSKSVNDKDDHEELSSIIKRFKSKIPITRIEIPTPTWNPCIAFNTVAQESLGEYLIVTNPECFHESNILAGMDEEFEKNPNIYIMCGCMNKKRCNLYIEKFEDLHGEEAGWYQHSIYRNAQFHFCAGISKGNWDKIGGFDEDFRYGTSFEDADFRNRVRRANVPFILRDDLLTIHISHASLWGNSKLNEINRKVFTSKWG